MMISYFSEVNSLSALFNRTMVFSGIAYSHIHKWVLLLCRKYDLLNIIILSINVLILKNSLIFIYL